MSDRRTDIERSGLDEIEPPDNDSNRVGERQEPEDDYYIRNYVLKDDTPQSSSEETQAPPAKKPESPPKPVAEAQAPAVPQGPEAESVPPATFGMRTFAPGEVSETPKNTPSPGQAVDLTREESLTDALSDLLESSPELEAAMLVSLDGLPMASALPAGMEEDRVAAMSAAILGLGERASAELGRGELRQVFVEGKEGYVFLMSAGGKAVLTALAHHGVKIGLVFYDMKHAAQKIADIL